MIEFFQFARRRLRGTLSPSSSASKKVCRNLIQCHGWGDENRAPLTAAPSRMTLDGGFEHSHLRSRATARTKLVRDTILDRTVRFFSRAHKRVGELAFAPDNTPPARWALARETLEDGREVRVRLEAHAKRHLCEWHVRA